MKVALTNLSNSLYQRSRMDLNRSAKQYGITEIYSYDFDRDIRHTAFYAENERILSLPRGLGYWLWKPYIILESMNKLQDGDILVYSDSGIEIIADLSPLINICKSKEPILLFGNQTYMNSQFTKRDCFIAMNCDSGRYWNSMQVDAAFMLFRKNDATMSFLNEWMQYCKFENLITDAPNVYGKENLPNYSEHRHDQSVISVLAEKYNINLYRKPTHYSSNVVFVPVKIQEPVTNKSRRPGISQKAGKVLVGANGHEMSSQALPGVEQEPLLNGKDEQYDVKYDYAVAYNNSAYGRLLFHHRQRNTGFITRVRYRFKIAMMKRLMKLGYVLVKA
jgi:hypothetical protein